MDILSADKSSGHAAGFDDAIVDELGLFAERDRALVSGMRSSTSAKDGRFIALSILGDAPFTRELVDRADDPAVALHLYRAPDERATLPRRRLFPVIPLSYFGVPLVPIMSFMLYVNAYNVKV